MDEAHQQLSCLSGLALIDGERLHGGDQFKQADELVAPVCILALEQVDVRGQHPPGKTCRA